MPVDTATVRSKLEAILADLDRTVAILRGVPAGDGPPDDLPAYDKHPADAGAYLSEADRTEAVLQAAEDQRVAIRAALGRLDEGVYGICVDCDKPVPEGRLEARPEAARCVKCQAKRDKYRR
ncbi:MAG: conjugal transfer protein TraR [Streptosporangiales bacterium]|nr:conjugal transfer protein TraR [Streptosporangiales bacterium]